jgi:fission process protein 1
MTTTQPQDKHTHTSHHEKGYNVFRDSLCRYLGYANEVGESFRYQFPGLVRPSYVVAFGYCCADAVSTGWTVYNKIDNSEHVGSALDARNHNTLHATVDTLLWQSLASVMLPGATINMVVKASRLIVQKSPLAVPVLVSQWLPTAMGLGSIPLIVQPIDNGVDYILDRSTRQWWTVVGASTEVHGVDQKSQ